MPYKREGKNVMHKKDDHWTVKQHCTSVANAEKAIRLLRGVKHGMKVKK